MASVFVYGTLLESEVVRILLNRNPSSSPAVLRDYRRFSVNGCSYPAIIPEKNKKVEGKVLFGITDPDLRVLDAFEDFEYDRSVVEVSLMDQNQPRMLQSFAYVWSQKDDPRLEGEWDFDEWRKKYVEEYLKSVKEFREEYDASGSNGVQ
ncbi:AIG2-like (avirulence induced gene) family protein [Wolffia australiana]